MKLSDKIREAAQWMEDVDNSAGANILREQADKIEALEANVLTPEEAVALYSWEGDDDEAFVSGMLKLRRIADQGERS